jgi:hypothetical protein
VGTGAAGSPDAVREGSPGVAAGGCSGAVAGLPGGVKKEPPGVVAEGCSGAVDVSSGAPEEVVG